MNNKRATGKYAIGPFACACCCKLPFSKMKVAIRRYVRRSNKNRADWQ